MKAVMKSVSPQICEKIASGDCTILVSKTAPKCGVPFKCYIYESKNGGHRCKHCNEKNSCYSYAPKNVGCYNGRGRVIGEFVCDKIEKFDVPYPAWDRSYLKDILEKSCLSYSDLHSYIGSGNRGYAWHISDLKIYDKPKELSEFRASCPTSCENCKNPLYYECWCEEKGIKVVTRAPQSWQYVEEL